MRLWRVYPAGRAAERDEGGPLWFPRQYQGDGRHDNPDLYGAMYLATIQLAAVVEALAPFRGTGRAEPALLRRMGRPLALAEIELADDVAIVDLDDPAVLVAEGLRPSQVATRRRQVTQNQAACLFRLHPDVAGLGWWSTQGASWPERTVFDRAAHQLEVASVVPLDLRMTAVVDALAFLGLG